MSRLLSRILLPLTIVIALGLLTWGIVEFAEATKRKHRADKLAEAGNPPAGRFSITSFDEAGRLEAWVLRDRQTGECYLVVRRSYCEGIAVCPMSSTTEEK